MSVSTQIRATIYISQSNPYRPSHLAGGQAWALGLSTMRLLAAGSLDKASDCGTWPDWKNIVFEEAVLGHLHS